MIPKSRPSRGEERGGGSGYRCWSAAAFSFFSASRPFLWAEKSRPSASLACSGAAARALRCRERRCYRAMVPIPPNGPSPLSLSLSPPYLSPPSPLLTRPTPFPKPIDRSPSLSLSRFSVPLYGGFMQSSDNEEYQVSSSPPDLHHRESWRILVSSRERRNRDEEESRRRYTQ